MRGLALLFVAVVATAFAAGPSLAASADCGVADRSTKDVLSGVTLTWDSSFRCANAPDSGTYSIRVTVSNAERSAEAVEIRRLRLSHTTPRPRGQAPDATAEAQGLPLTVRPGERKSFRVSGRYELVTTDEGDKANLHLRARGRGLESGDAFRLAINVHLRGPGAGDNGDRRGAGRPERDGGPPAWAGGPPAWAGAPRGRGGP